MPGTQRTASASSRPPNEAEVLTLVAGLATKRKPGFSGAAFPFDRLETSGGAAASEGLWAKRLRPRCWVGGGTREGVVSLRESDQRIENPFHQGEELLAPGVFS